MTFVGLNFLTYFRSSLKHVEEENKLSNIPIKKCVEFCLLKQIGPSDYQSFYRVYIFIVHTFITFSFLHFLSLSLSFSF